MNEMLLTGVLVSSPRCFLTSNRSVLSSPVRALLGQVEVHSFGRGGWYLTEHCSTVRTIERLQLLERFVETRRNIDFEICVA